MSDKYSKLLNQLLDGKSMPEDQAFDLMQSLARDEISPALAGALLAGLRAKGETADEIRGFATAMRELALKPKIPDGTPIVDTVGTGGDGSGSLNLSTGVGLLAAACGARVVKHGNRSVSSRSGSADMIECLGLTLPTDEKSAIDLLEVLGFTFLFSPAFHPAMKAIMPVRGAMGVRTVFNMLGPLSNPAAPPYQLVGAFSAEAAKLMAHTLAGMPIKRVFVVHGEPGWDEATPIGRFVLYDVKPDSVKETYRHPKDYGLNCCTAQDLVGAGPEHNAKELKRVFKGEDKGPHRDALLMGTSLVLEVIGVVSDAVTGVNVAQKTIDEGRAEDFLERIQTISVK